MKLSNSLRRIPSKVYNATLVGTLIWAIILCFLSFRGSWSLLSIPIAASIILMLTGQVSTITSYSFVYPLYYVSSMVSLILALFIWMNNRFPSLEVYLGILFAMSSAILVVHLFARKRIGAFPMFPVFSIFLFGLLISLSTTQLTGQTLDSLFWLSMLLFVFVMVQVLNTAYRAMVLNRELGMSSIDNYIEECRKRLIAKFGVEISDVDLLLYYFRSALDRFVEGDFVSSFVDAYKVVFDEGGRAFKKVYVLPVSPEIREKAGSCSEIRAILTHAKGREATLPRIRETKKRLFQNTLDLLKLLKTGFIEGALEDERNVTEAT